MKPSYENANNITEDHAYKSPPSLLSNKDRRSTLPKMASSPSVLPEIGGKSRNKESVSPSKVYGTIASRRGLN